MEERKSNKVIITFLVIINIVLVVLVILLATGTISFKSNVVEDQMVEEKENIDEEIVLTEAEEKGLELYKYFVGNGSGPFKWENGTVTNYDEVMSKMTVAYKNSFKDSDNGFTIPLLDNGTWKSSGGYGADKESKFKDIKVTLVDSCKIHYEITYTYTKIGEPNGIEQEDINEFIAKISPCNQDDADTDFSNGYKVDSFKLVYGLKFE